MSLLGPGDWWWPWCSKHSENGTSTAPGFAEAEPLAEAPLEPEPVPEPPVERTVRLRLSNRALLQALAKEELLEVRLVALGTARQTSSRCPWIRGPSIHARMKQWEPDPPSGYPIFGPNPQCFCCFPIPQYSRYHLSPFQYISMLHNDQFPKIHDQFPKINR